MALVIKERIPNYTINNGTLSLSLKWIPELVCLCRQISLPQEKQKEQEILKELNVN